MLIILSVQCSSVTAHHCAFDSYKAYPLNNSPFSLSPAPGTTIPLSVFELEYVNTSSMGNHAVLYFLTN